MNLETEIAMSFKERFSPALDARFLSLLAVGAIALLAAFLISGKQTQERTGTVEVYSLVRER
jgi:hypothetical protein